MGRLFVCALFFAFLPTGAWADTPDEETPAELTPAKTSFAYRVRHSWNPLPGEALNALADHARRFRLKFETMEFAEDGPLDLAAVEMKLAPAPTATL